MLDKPVPSCPVARQQYWDVKSDKLIFCEDSFLEGPTAADRSNVESKAATRQKRNKRTV